MRILVTGAAGFIGSHVCEALAKHEVLGVDNFNDYYDPELKRQNAAVLKKQGITIKKIDIRDKRFLSLTKKFTPDVIVHLAAMAGVRYSIEKPLLYMNVNVDGTQHVLEAAKHTQAYVVFGSSSSVYGTRTNPPFSELDRIEQQISPYAASKAAGELLCRTHYLTTKLPVTCLRFFTVYGPRGRPDMAPRKFMEAILANKEITQYGDGTSARDYTYVEDIVYGVVQAVLRPNGFSVYNLGNDTPHELHHLITTIERVTQKKAKITHVEVPLGDVPLTCADIRLAQKELLYQPRTPLSVGLTKQYEWLTQ